MSKELDKDGKRLTLYATSGDRRVVDAEERQVRSRQVFMESEDNVKKWNGRKENASSKGIGRDECSVVGGREDQHLCGCGSREALCQGSYLKPMALKSRQNGFRAAVSMGDVVGAVGQGCAPQNKGMMI